MTIDPTTIGIVITAVTFAITVIGTAIKIFKYINDLRTDNQQIRLDFQKELMQLAEDNAKFRMSVQIGIADLTLMIEQKFVRKDA